MKKFIGYIAAAAVSASMLAANTFAVNNVVRGAEDIVNGAANGVRDAANGVGNAAEDIAGGTTHNAADVTDHDITDITTAAAAVTTAHSEVPGTTNPNTGATLGFIGLGIGSAIAAGAAAASRRRK